MSRPRHGTWVLAETHIIRKSQKWDWSTGTQHSPLAQHLPTVQYCLAGNSILSQESTKMSQAAVIIVSIPMPHGTWLYRPLSIHSKGCTIPGTWLQKFSFDDAGLFLKKFRALLPTSKSNVLHIPAPAPESWWETPWMTCLGAGAPGGPLGGFTVFRHDAWLDSQREGVLHAKAEGREAEDSRT